MAHPRLERLNQGLDWLLYRFSTYALPIFIGLASLLALFAWQTQYPASEPQPLEIQVLRSTEQTAEPAAALAALRSSATSKFHDTRLSEAPFWLLFNVPQDTEGRGLSVEFPSRHAMSLSCWDGATLKPLGHASRTGTAEGMAPVKAGFALDLSPGLQGSQVLCQTSSVGPARISVLKWQTADLQVAGQEFHRNAGLLDGGIIVLALFVLVTALINRSGLYVLFAGWLIVNLRMGALSAGWDTQWLGHAVPFEWLAQGRLVTLSLYYLLTLTLFITLFKDDLRNIGHDLLVRAAQWTCFPLLALSLVLPYASFLPIMWPVAGVGMAVLAFLLVRILQKTRSRVAIWYSAAIGVTLLASFSEVIAAALGIKGMIGTVNSVTAALSSSLLTALAIAEQMRQEHEQRVEVQAELQHTFDAMPIGLFTLDPRGRFMSANPALQDMLGADVLSDKGGLWPDYFVEGAWTQLHQMVYQKSSGEMEIDARLTDADGSPRRFLVKATLARDKIEGSLQDVTEKSRATENLYFLANHDSLTKVLNRRGIEKVLNGAIEKFDGGQGEALALAYLDLDRFKLINDLYGHSAGDDVLQQVCKRVSDMLSGGVQFGRVGGDEFVIIFPNTPIALASLVCRGIVDNIGTRPYRIGEKAFYVRGSIGLIEVGVGMEFKDAISTADRACRDAKAAGGLVVYEKLAVAFQQHEAELKLIAQLSTSTATEGLYLEMQPIMSLTAPHESLNFEVLLRMRDAEGKNIPTDRLITAGEFSGRMSMIDRWVLSTTLNWLNAHHAQMKDTKFICMNLSGASLNDERFLQDVYALLEQNAHVAKQLCLEITESVALHDLDNTRRFVNKVRSLGAKVALDDFGAGYTSFSYLKEFTADLLKIDGSFIVDMNQHPANIAIVEAIVSLARNLGMKVIAEWAEDNATVQTLTEIGVDYVQGFAVARPQHPDRLLGAESSASFIQDADLNHYVDMIGKPDTVLSQVDLFNDTATGKLH
jgi:diguanylate cyclase (GGDEF)-like protein/PAS domain S-box-containing protein